MNLRENLKSLKKTATKKSLNKYSKEELVSIVYDFIEIMLDTVTVLEKTVPKKKNPNKRNLKNLN
jgi:hypothetical protein